MMNRPEFLRGWLLLTAQPWGKAYRSEAAQTSQEPSPAKIQAELYYQTFQTVVADLWVKACTQQATGEHWPSIDMMRQALRHLTPANPLLTNHDSAGWITKEEFGVNQGVNLYDVIKLIGGILANQDQMNAAVHREADLTALKQTKERLKTELIQAMGQLTASEETEIVQRYPIVATL